MSAPNLIYLLLLLQFLLCCPLFPTMLHQKMTCCSGATELGSVKQRRVDGSISQVIAMAKAAIVRSLTRDWSQML